MTLFTTSAGARFGFEGEIPRSPAPTLFTFSSNLETSLNDPDFCEAGQLLREKGALNVALDVPCHGADIRPNEPQGLHGWRARIEQGENFFPVFTANCREALDYLIAQGYADPARVAVSGTSRGGFSALHMAAADARVKYAAAFAPVTRLCVLSEFDGMEDHPLVTSLALVNQADALARRSLWLVIGNRDERVNTGYAVEFAQAVVAAHAGQEAEEQTTDVTLLVVPAVGHSTPDNAHTLAAQWLAEKLEL